jgi:GH15 family glucan-1,4-alpha-glucosidase
MQMSVQDVLDSLRMQNGLYVASPSNTYHYIWIRDNCYIALSELDGPNHRYEQTYHALLDIFHKHEWKLTYHSVHKPREVYEYIHPRYDAQTKEEVWGPWGNAQNDAIGAFLFGIGEGMRRGLRMLRDESDAKVVSLLIKYLQTVEFWHDADNGMWEENRELHASSIGACTAGLLAIQPYFHVDMSVIKMGLHALFDLLPRESALHEYDLALLSLVYPYRLLPEALSRPIVDAVENQLLRRRGVIRYPGDAYYNDDGQEAEWCMGLPWLGLCHLLLGNVNKAQDYLHRVHEVMTPEGAIPELYLAQQGIANENTPLGWANALYLVLSQLLMKNESTTDGEQRHRSIHSIRG